MDSFPVGIPRGICQLCAPGIWPLAHLRWCLGTQQLLGPPRCGVDEKVPVHEHRRGTRRPLSHSPLGSGGLRLSRVAGSNPPPTPASDRPSGGHRRKRALRKSGHAAAPPPPTRGIPWSPPCSLRPNPHLTPRAAHLGHAGETARRRGDTRERLRLHGGHNLRAEPAANSSRNGEASSPSP